MRKIIKFPGKKERERERERNHRKKRKREREIIVTRKDSRDGFRDEKNIHPCNIELIPKNNFLQTWRIILLSWETRGGQISSQGSLIGGNTNDVTPSFLRQRGTAFYLRLELLEKWRI